MPTALLLCQITIWFTFKLILENVSYIKASNDWYFLKQNSTPSLGVLLNKNTYVLFSRQSDYLTCIRSLSFFGWKSKCLKIFIFILPCSSIALICLSNVQLQRKIHIFLCFVNLWRCSSNNFLPISKYHIYQYLLN